MRRQPGGNYKKIAGTKKTYKKTRKRRAIANKTKGKTPTAKGPGKIGALNAVGDAITGVAGANIILCILSSDIVPKLYNVCCIKNRTKHNSKTPLSLVRCIGRILESLGFLLVLFV